MNLEQEKNTQFVAKAMAWEKYRGGDPVEALRSFVATDESIPSALMDAQSSQEFGEILADLFISEYQCFVETKDLEDFCTRIHEQAQELAKMELGSDELVNFDELQPVDRVEAILATVKEPVSEKYSMKLAGVEWSDLSTEEMSALQNLLDDNRTSDGKVFIEDDTSTLENLGVDSESVHEAISSHLMNTWKMLKQGKG